MCIYTYIWTVCPSLWRRASSHSKVTKYIYTHIHMYYASSHSKVAKALLCIYTHIYVLCLLPLEGDKGAAMRIHTYICTMPPPTRR